MSVKTLISDSIDLRETSDKTIELRTIRSGQLMVLTPAEFLDLCALVKSIEAYADFMGAREP